MGIPKPINGAGAPRTHAVLAQGLGVGVAAANTGIAVKHSQKVKVNAFMSPSSLKIYRILAKVKLLFKDEQRQRQYYNIS
jgi:hypothetical protein